MELFLTLFQVEHLLSSYTLIEKLRKQSHLKYSLPLYLRLLSPSIISTHKTELLVNRFKKFLKCLQKSGWIPFGTAHQAKSEYKVFVSDQAIVTEFSIFDIHSDRIDVVLDMWCKVGHIFGKLANCVLSFLMEMPVFSLDF